MKKYEVGSNRRERRGPRLESPVRAGKSPKKQRRSIIVRAVTDRAGVIAGGRRFAYGGRFAYGRGRGSDYGAPEPG
ncbi:MAG: hypothetical protein P8X95_05750 [Anaerolineales bacterium]